PPKPYLHPLGDKGTLYNPPSARHRYEINPASITNRGEPAYKQTSPPPRQNSAALPTTRHHAVRSTRYQSETNLLSTAGDPTRWRTGTAPPRWASFASLAPSLDPELRLGLALVGRRARGLARVMLRVDDGGAISVAPSLPTARVSLWPTPASVTTKRLLGERT